MGVRIGDLSARTGASVRSIRYYEKQGLIASARSESGQRSFGEEAVERVVLIRRLFDAGLSSRTMADLLPCITDPRARTPYLAQRLREERDRVVVQVEQLSRTVEALDTVIGDLASAPDRVLDSDAGDPVLLVNGAEPSIGGAGKVATLQRRMQLSGVGAGRGRRIPSTG